MTWRIPYFELRLGVEEKQAVLEVLESNWLTSGPRIEKFETAFVEALDTPGLHAVAVSSCTAALHLSAIALGIGPSDEVICPSLTFVATANAIRYCGATPVFADIASESDWNIDRTDVERKITRRTRALMLMHYGGYAGQVEGLLHLAEKHGLRVIEDACHGLLAEYRGRKLGTLGDVGCFSFFSNKNMTTGEGGMIVTRSAKLAEECRSLRSHGMTSTSYERFRAHAFGYDVVRLGFNYRMDEIRAALGMVQLRKLAGHNEERKRCVLRYRKAIASAVPQALVPFLEAPEESGYHVFPVLLPEGTDRTATMQALAERGVQTSIHYRPVHSFTAYRDLRADVPRTDRIASRILSLPLYPTLRDEEVDYVVHSLAQCL